MRNQRKFRITELRTSTTTVVRTGMLLRTTMDIAMVMHAVQK